MNKWVVLILMALAFLAGGLSFFTLDQKRDTTASPSPVQATPGLAGSPTPIATGVGHVEPTPTSAQGSASRRPRTGNPFDSNPEASKAEGRVKALIFSESSGGNARTRFSEDTESVYMTMTPEAVADDVEIVAKFRSSLNEKDEFSEPVQSSGPPRRRTFRFARPKDGWTKGPYQVMVKTGADAEVLTLTRFEITSSKLDTPQYKDPEYLELVRDASSTDTVSIFYANDQEILLRVATFELKTGVVVRSVWSAVEVDKLTPGELVAVSDLQAPGPEQDSIFKFAPPRGGFLPGSYRVDIYFDQQLVGSQAFFVQPPPPTPEASETPALER